MIIFDRHGPSGTHNHHITPAHDLARKSLREIQSLVIPTGFRR